MTTTLTITSGQTSFSAQGYVILPSPGTAVPDGLVQNILAQAQLAGVTLSSSSGVGVTYAPSRRFVSTGTGPPVAGAFLLGDEWVDSLGAEYECIAAGSPGTWVAAQSGTFGPVYGIDPTSVTYGAKGDAYLLHDAAISSGSASLQSSRAGWSAAVTGRTVQVAGAGVAGGLLTATATYVDASHVTLSVAASTTVSGKSALVYRASDTAALQAALTAAAAVANNPLLPGAEVKLPPGGFAVSGLNIDSRVTFSGVRGASHLFLLGGSSSSLLQTVGYSSLVGTGAETGPSQFKLRGLIFHGFKSGQTNSSLSGAKLFGYDFDVEGCIFRDFTDTGLYTEWGAPGGASSPANSDAMESRIHGNKFHDNGAYGWHNNGPHDSVGAQNTFWNNATAGYWGDVGSSGTQLDGGIHSWGSQQWAYIIDAEHYCYNCEAEGGTIGQVLVRAALTWDGPVYHTTGAGLGFQIGDGTHTPAPMKITSRMANFPGTSSADCALSYVAGSNMDVNLFVTHPTPGTGSIVYGTLPTIGRYLITQSNGTIPQQAAASTIKQSGVMTHWLPSSNANTIRWSDGTTEFFRYRSDNKWFDFPNGTQLRLYSDAFSTAPITLDGANGIATVQPTADTNRGVVVKQFSASQSANLLEFQNSGGSMLGAIDKGGKLYITAGNTQTTAPSAGGGSALPATPTGYAKIVVNGTDRWIPYY